MKHEITNGEGLSRTIKFELDAKDLATIKSDVVKTMSRGVKVEGFRKGKAPAKMVEASLDQAKLHNEIINDAVNFYFTKAAMDEELDVLGKPNVEIGDYKPDESLTFEATFEVAPEIKIADPAKLKVERQENSVEDSQVDEVIENIRTSMAAKEVVEREAKTGDEVWIDFDGRDKHGEPIEGAKGEEYPLNIGSNTFIPGFEDAIISHSAGDEFDFETSFPDDYHAKKLAGAEVVFKIKVREVKQVVKPEVNDDLAKEVAQLGSVDELRADIEKNLQQRADFEAEDKYRNEVLEAMISHKDTEIDVPQVMMDEQRQMMLDDIRRNMATRGVTMDQYLADNNFDSEEDMIKAEVDPAAEKRIMMGLSLSKIAKDYEISVDDDELDTQINIIKGQQENAAELQQHLSSPAGRADVRNKMMTEKSLKKLVDLTKGE